MSQLLAPYTFTTQASLFEKITNNTSSENDDFANTFIAQYTSELIHKFPALFSEQSFLMQTFPNVRYYTLPLQIRKINTVVINVGNVEGTTTTGAGFNWPVKEAPSMEFWNNINMVNNITSDIPLWYFFYNGQLGIYPMPASGYNPITIRAQVEPTPTSQPDYTTGTIVAVPLAGTLTGSPLLGATSVTLSAPWALPSGTYQILLSDGEIILATFTNSSAIVALQHEIVGTPNYPIAFTSAPTGLTGTLTANFALASGTYQITFSDGEIISATFTNGSAVVAFQTAITGTPSSVAYVNNSTGGNIVNISTAVTIRTAQGGDIITGSGTSWNASMVGYMIRIPYSSSVNGGDNFPYIINQVFSATVLALSTPYAGTAMTGASSTYAIGQVSIIPTAYQLIPVYRSAELYYATVAKDKELREKYKDLADTLFAQLTADQGNKDTDPTVQDDFGTPMVNPNLAINLTQSTNG